MNLRFCKRKLVVFPLGGSDLVEKSTKLDGPHLSEHAAGKFFLGPADRIVNQQGSDRRYQGVH